MSIYVAVEKFTMSLKQFSTSRLTLKNLADLPNLFLVLYEYGCYSEGYSQLATFVVILNCDPTYSSER